jgi:hypothetical protein
MPQAGNGEDQLSPHRFAVLICIVHWLFLFSDQRQLVSPIVHGYRF